MDSKQLEANLKNFFQTCKSEGYEIESACLIKNETDYTLEVKSKWIENYESRSQVLDILLDILWKTTTAEIRRYIFAISVLDSHEQPHCYGELLLENKII